MKKLIKDHLVEIIVIGVIVIALAITATTLAIIYSGSTYSVATIYYQKEELEEVELTEEEYTFSLEDERFSHIVFGVKDYSIAFLENDCPTLDCVKMGYTSNPLKVLVCAHYQVSIQLSGEVEGNIDLEL